MALILSCSCGAHFEVEDTFAGQTVSCPECHASLKAPVLRPGPLRTSGLAVASMVLALVGAFTFVGTLAAVLCGLAALVSIGRSGGRRAGVGFALFGIIAGVLFTGLTLFAYSTGELFGVGDQIRERRLGGLVDYSGPLEIVRPDPGFKITRPSEKWGVAKPELCREFQNTSSLLLVNPARDAYVDVSSLSAVGRGIDALRQDVIKSFEDDGHKGKVGQDDEDMRRVLGVKVRDSKRVESAEGYEVGEVVLDVRLPGQTLTYLIHVVKKPRAARAYLVRSWTGRRRYPQEEADLRKVIDSFRIVE
jgi:hypothetical protein